MRSTTLCIIALSTVLCTWCEATASEHNARPVAHRTVTSASGLQLDVCTMQAGGHVGTESGYLEMGITLGQPVAGEAASDNWLIGLGYWYGQSHSIYCAVEVTGDVNFNGSISSSDIIYLVNYVFKSAAAPLPCEASGDVNCSGLVSAADVIYLVNHVFKGQVAPCDVCSMMPGTWTCP